LLAFKTASNETIHALLTSIIITIHRLNGRVYHSHFFPIPTHTHWHIRRWQSYVNSLHPLVPCKQASKSPKTIYKPCKFMFRDTFDAQPTYTPRLNPDSTCVAMQWTETRRYTQPTCMTN
jgi:hypothetical protein